MARVAVLGASGFIGTRIVEMFHLGGMAEVRAVVRNPAGLASIARFDVDYRIADALDRKALTQALRGVEYVIDAVKGPDESIESSVEPIYRAAEDAGVRRIVYLSTASVHGQAPPHGTTEETPIHDRQPVSYNNAKVRAERRFAQLRASGKVELVVLRPAIVYGPRSYWTDGFADALLDGTAYVVDGARGICNAVYVDNLVFCMHAALFEPRADRETFLIVDDETVAWPDLWRPIARALGFDFARIPNLRAPPPHRAHWTKLFEHARPPRPILGALPATLKSRVKGALNGLTTGWRDAIAPSPWETSLPPLTASEEMAALQRCEYKFPNEKARRIIGPYQRVPFDEGLRRSIGWLAFAGYPAT